MFSSTNGLESRFLSKTWFKLYLHNKSNILNFEGVWFFLMSDNSILPTTPWRTADGHVEEATLQVWS